MAAESSGLATRGLGQLIQYCYLRFGNERTVALVDQVKETGFLWATLGGVSYTGSGGLTLYAAFDEIGGLKPRAQVVIGGVRIGQVKQISLSEDYQALVMMNIDEEVSLPIDTEASILTAGVLGDQYIALEPIGIEEGMLRPGDEIAITHGAVVLERLIGKFLQSIGD